MVHREDSRSARMKAQGAQIEVADMSDVERVANALKGVQRAYYCPPLDPYMIQGAVAFAVAAKEARLEHIVGVTQWLASPSHPSLMTRQHWLVDHNGPVLTHNSPHCPDTASPTQASRNISVNALVRSPPRDVCRGFLDSFKARRWWK